MTILIDDFVSGDDLEIERTVTAIPSGLLITTAEFMVKKRYSDADDSAIISKLATTVFQSTIGWVEDTGADTSGLIHFYLTPDDTSLLVGYSEYPYSIRIVFNNGNVYTRETGLIVATPAVNRGT